MSKFKVYTKTGDKGKTSLIGGTRVDKFDLRLHSYGTVDELNSHVGLIYSELEDKELKKELLFIQNKLFVVGSVLATDTEKSDMHKKMFVKAEDIELLEKAIDKMDEELPELDSFILPGGSRVGSFCHIARTVCRRAERNALELSQSVEIDPILLKFLNRLSDYLFVLSRKLLNDAGVPEIKWLT
ncbi:MAG: cob(I)yrinic acid a,c-diamide adenosyltransferase [Marinifilaceae bacterium]|jgi:cob(I)alamin adenosyltransferase|nr:cob(I)yrinic acid a,c-diamide adenosyltransferase [Marinifilaceae bacterium]